MSRTCVKCTKELETIWSFCPFCGTPIAIQAEEALPSVFTEKMDSFLIKSQEGVRLANVESKTNKMAQKTSAHRSEITQELQSADQSRKTVTNTKKLLEKHIDEINEWQTQIDSLPSVEVQNEFKDSMAAFIANHKKLIAKAKQQLTELNKEWEKGDEKLRLTEIKEDYDNIALKFYETCTSQRNTIADPEISKKKVQATKKQQEKLTMIRDDWKGKIESLSKITFNHYKVEAKKLIDSINATYTKYDTELPSLEIEWKKLNDAYEWTVKKEEIDAYKLKATDALVVLMGQLNSLTAQDGAKKTYDTLRKQMDGISETIASWKAVLATINPTDMPYLEDSARKYTQENQVEFDKQSKLLTEAEGKYKKEFGVYDAYVKRNEGEKAQLKNFTQTLRDLDKEFKTYTKEVQKNLSAPFFTAEIHAQTEDYITTKFREMKKQIDSIKTTTQATEYLEENNETALSLASMNAALEKNIGDLVVQINAKFEVEQKKSATADQLQAAITKKDYGTITKTIDDLFGMELSSEERKKYNNLKEEKEKEKFDVEVEKHFEIARNFVSQQKFDDAMKKVDAILALPLSNEDKKRFTSFKGKITEDKANFKTLAKFEEVKKFRGEQNYDDALNVLDKIIEEEPDLEKAWLEKAAIEMALYDVKAAIISYEKCLSINKSSDQAWHGKAQVLKQMRNPKEAAAAFQKAVSLNPGNISAWTDYGLFNLEQGKPKDAVANYDKALELLAQEPNSELETLVKTRKADAQKKLGKK